MLNSKSKIVRRIHFAFSHPITTLRYLCGDKEPYFQIIGKEDAREFLGQLVSVDRARAKKFLSESKKLCLPIIYRALTEHEKADPSGMRFKAPLLYVLARELKPEVIVETGVASGVSTLFFLQALEDNGSGKLYSVDLPNVEEASKMPPGYKSGWIIHIC